MRSLRLLPPTILAASILAACSSTPGGVIPPNKMAPLLADIYVGEAVVETVPRDYPDDSTRQALKQSILSRHGYTTVEFDSSLCWYGRNLSKFMEVSEEVEKILQERIKDAETRGAQGTVATRNTSIDGDSVNLWNGPSHQRIYPHIPADYYTVTLFRDKNWERGDRYTLSAKGVMTQAPVTLMLIADYNDGTSEYVSLGAGGEDMHRLTLVLDSAKVATEVRGFIRYVAPEGEVSYLDSISLVRTRGRNDNKVAREGQKLTHNR
ncbi:MAG: DUF4296 domain-containing protein [Duncaniella sp.]|nr:DUF4296 domain-containing protein [Duncaniella sp.]